MHSKIFLAALVCMAVLGSVGEIPRSGLVTLRIVAGLLDAHAAAAPRVPLPVPPPHPEPPPPLPARPPLPPFAAASSDAAKPPATASSVAAPQRPNRKLLQSSWSPTTSTQQQVAAARVARWNTQQAIRAAVDNPFPAWQYDATRTATAVGQIGADLAANDPCRLVWTSDCWRRFYPRGVPAGYRA